jgi:expansin (peptidoglycan-binding protein)
MRVFGLTLLLFAACDDGSIDETDPIGGSCEAAPADATGEATFYDATGAGNCSFDPSPGDLLVGAMNATDYGTADWCGGCVEVDGPDGSVVVRIVDQCPGCAKGDVDLSREAFAMIAPLSAGRVDITWREAPCEVDGPVEYHFQDGANEFYTALQLRNHRYPIATLEAEVDGAYREIERLEYNYFVEPDGLGDGPYKLRVTDVRGHVLEDDGIELGDDVSRSGAAQFPLCPQ